MKTMLMFTALIALTTGTALAEGTRDPGVNTRQVDQHARVRNGVQTGELTRRETKHLREEQRDIRQLERAYKSDGKLTRAERADLHHEQNQASRQIRRQKHDRQERR